MEPSRVDIEACVKIGEVAAFYWLIEAGEEWFALAGCSDAGN